MPCSVGEVMEFNRNFIHDKRRNMYTLSIKMKCIVLASIRKKVELKTKKMKNLLSLS
jgi:hypothetical protein